MTSEPGDPGDLRAGPLSKYLFANWHVLLTVYSFILPGALHDGFSEQCCNGDIISTNMTCCGDALKGTAYLTDSEKICCGQNYVPAPRTACCTSRGVSKVNLMLHLLKIGAFQHAQQPTSQYLQTQAADEPT